ncbi:TPA: antirestriction protein ArdA, partial [Klebsiella pneumoniae]|nr:antirestriction protein ArdA [Klebsiella pneumoniae]
QDEGRAAAFVAWAGYTGECDYDAFDEAYCGEAESEEDFAYGFVEDHGLLNEVPESLRVYFDYEAYARDLFSSGYVFHEGYVFSN